MEKMHFSILSYRQRVSAVSATMSIGSETLALYSPAGVYCRQQEKGMGATGLERREHGREGVGGNGFPAESHQHVCSKEHAVQGEASPRGVNLTKNRPIVRRGEGGWERWGGPLWSQSGGLCGPWGGRLAPQRLWGQALIPWIKRYNVRVGIACV